MYEFVIWAGTVWFAILVKLSLAQLRQLDNLSAWLFCKLSLHFLHVPLVYMI